MENAITYIAILVGLIAVFNIFEIIFYRFFGIKNKSIFKWLSYLGCAILLFKFPNLHGIFFMLLGFVVFTMSKMMFLVQSIKTSNS